MTNDALLVLRTLMSSIWALFTSWHIPGTNVTPAMWSIFAILVVFVVKFVIPNILSIGLSDHSGGGK